ncbi:MAG: methyltransferase domain-containing protein [Isosphaeraceae bacterium]|nr:methyltransferase domain-containing protein [Isosphaeraceae bacterium]
MTHAPALYEAEVGARFDRLQGRFKESVDREDFRLRALREVLGPLEGRRILDLGCGKGRFGRRLADGGAAVVGLDLSAAMLASASGLPRVRGSARRLPLASGVFDAVIAVEVFEHLPGLDDVLAEARRVLRPGGLLAVIDKNAAALNAQRPWLPALLVKAIDERRGRWMYPHGGPVRERWFRPGALVRRLGTAAFTEVDVTFLLGPRESDRRIFRSVPRARLLALWTARVPGGAIHG